MWDPKSPWADPRVRKAASLAIDRQALSDADTLGASKPNGNIVLKRFEYALPIEPDPYDPAQAKKLLAEAGYPNGFDARRPHSGTAVLRHRRGDCAAISARSASRPGCARWSGPRSSPRSRSKKLKGLCFCATAEYGNASTRMAAIVPSNGSLAYGGFRDIDELYQRQLTETDPAKREAMLHQIQKLLHERTRFAPIFDYFWPSGLGPRVEEASLMKIDPFPWSAPLEDVRLKQP